MLNRVPLIEVAEFINGMAVKPEEWSTEGLSIIRIQNLTGSTNITNYFNSNYDPKYLVENGDILISWSASLGVYIWNGGNAILNQHIFKCNLHKGVDKTYFYYAVTSILDDLKNKVHGSTMQHITKEPFESTLIPLPLLHEQQRIAAILQKADRIRRLRRHARQLSDSYLQSVFLEMFGDPVDNPKRYDFVKLGDLISFMTSGSRGWAEHYSDKGALFLRVQNVGANSLLLDDVAFVQPPNTAESRRTRVQSGDLLISATADIGRTGVIPDNFPEAYINQHLFLIRLKNFNPIFIAGYFSTPSGKAQILRLDREGVKSGLNFDDAKGLTVFNTPMADQERFAAIVHRYDHLHFQQRESERQGEHLFQSLLQRAFQGDL